MESFVLHVVPAAITAGDVAGEVEHVASGRRAVVRDLDELRGFLASCVEQAGTSAPNEG